MTHQQLPNELRILLLAAQPGRDPAALHAALDPPPDWPAVFRLAHHHRLLPLIYLTLQHRVPPHLVERLRENATRNALAAVAASAELRRLSAAIPSLITLKGITLSQILYGSPNARHVGDLDLLIPDLLIPDPLVPDLRLSPLPSPIASLTALGYTVITPEAPLTPRRLRAYTRTLKDVTLSHPESPFELDLHWRLFNNPRHPANVLTAGPYVPVTVYNTTLRTLPLEDQFLYITAHALNESFTYLKTLADVSAFLRLMSPHQLDAALLRARALGLLPQVSAAIHLANSWMLTAHTSPQLLPETHPLARELHHRVTALYTRTAFAPDRTDTSPAAWSRLELLLTPGPRTLYEQARRFLVRPRLWQTVPLPDRLFFLYPLLALVIPPRAQSFKAAPGQSQAAPRTPLESPNTAGKIGVSNSPPNT